MRTTSGPACDPATLVKNPMPKPGEIHPFDSWDEIDAIAAELDKYSGPLVAFLAGTGARPEEAFGAEWAPRPHACGCPLRD